MKSHARIELLTAPGDDLSHRELAEVLLDCVTGGASLGFLAGLTATDASRWWEGFLGTPDVLTWVARDTAAGVIVGTVSLQLSVQPNGRHRAELVKLMVRREARGRNCAGLLLGAAERGARALGRTLLHLDTESGSRAERLYLRHGWRSVGQVQGWARSPDGNLRATTFMVKHLGV